MRQPLLSEGGVNRLADRTNRGTHGRLFGAYYGCNCTNLDDAGQPIMENAVGHDHISEMILSEFRFAAAAPGLRVADEHPIPVMSASARFDAHPLVLSASKLEAVHKSLRRSSWAPPVDLRAMVLA